nr:hypothetical protein [Tanacetum cinerariifolium]
MPQPMQNPKDSLDPTTAMNATLALLAKAFKVNTIPTNNNQRSSLILRNSQIAQPGMNTSQDIKMKMVDDNVRNQGLSVVLEIANQYGIGNIETTPGEGNGNGINGNLIRCYNWRGEAHYASNYTVKPRKRDAAYLQQQFNTENKSKKYVYDNASTFNPSKPSSKGFLNSSSLLGRCQIATRSSNKRKMYVSYTDLQTELDRTKEKLEYCIIKKEKEYDVLWNNWYIKCEECKYDMISYDKAYNDMQQKIEWLQAHLGDLKGKSSDTECASNTLDPLSQKLEHENMSLESHVLNYAKENAHIKT